MKENVKKRKISLLKRELKDIIDHTYIGVLIIDDKYKINFVNKAVSKIISHEIKNLIGKDFFHLFNEKNQKILIDYFNKTNKYNNIHLELEIYTKFSQIRYISLYTSPIIHKYRQKKIKYYIIYLTDISERKKVENALRKTNDFLTNLIENSVNSIIAADMKGNIIIFNKSAENLLGYTREEAITSLHVTKIYPEGLAKEIMKKLRANKGRITPSQFTVVSKTGEHIPVILSAALLYDEDNEEIASFGIFYDLRERIKIEKQLQETYVQLLQSEKMASLGKLGAGIAHEINNPLGGILIFAQMMLEELPEDDPHRDDLKRIIEETIRCKEIVKGLLEFSHQTSDKMIMTDLNRIVRKTIKLLENQVLFHNIKIIERLDPNLPQIMADPSQLNQVVTNIVFNAAEAMDGHGVLIITTRVCFEKNLVLLEFTDTGPGIPEEILPKIFDPFFTTKEVGKGTGLGLSTSYGIIEKHKGKILVNSKIGEGTTFIIELPIGLEIN